MHNNVEQSGVRFEERRGKERRGKERRGKERRGKEREKGNGLNVDLTSRPFLFYF